jgi:hypothetical protein
MSGVECISDSEEERRHNDADPRPSADDYDDSERIMEANESIMRSNNGITEISNSLSNFQKTSRRCKEPA